MNQSPDQPQPEIKDKLPRRFIINLGIYAAAANIVGFFNKALAKQPEQYTPPPTIAPTAEPTPTKLSTQTPTSTTIPTLPPSPTIAPTETKPAITPTPQKETFLDKVSKQELFIRCSTQEKAWIAKRVEDEFNGYQKQVGIDAKIKQTLDLKPTAINVLNILVFKPDSFLYKFFLPLIFAENKGDTDIHGLAQLEESTALEALKMLPENAKSLIKKRKDGSLILTDTQTNMALALEYLNHLYQRYQDPSLTLMAYNIGPGRVDECIKIVQKGPNPLARTNINYVTLIQNNSVLSYLQSLDRQNNFVQYVAKKYVPEISAAYILLEKN